MKRSLLVILALLLSLSLCLVGCNMGGNEATQKPTDNTAGENANNDETANNTPKLSPKEIVINTFNTNKLDELITALEEGVTADAMDMAGGGAMSEELKEVFKAMAVGADLSVTENGGGAVNVTAAMKDGYVYFSYEESDKQEYYIYLGGSTPLMFVKADGQWVSASGEDTPTTTPELEGGSVGESVSAENANKEMVEAIFAAIKNADIPELTEEHLTEKDGMLVLNNDFMIDIIDRNVEAIATAVGEEITAEEKTEGMTQVRELVSAMGLELALGTDEDSVTKISISVEPTDSEKLEELIGDVDMGSIKLAVEFTSDGNNIKKLEFNTSADHSDIAEGLKAENSITVNSIMKGDEVVGADVDVKISVIENKYNYTDSDSAEDDYTETFTKVFSTVTVDAVVDFSKIDTAGGEILKLSASSKIDKAVEMSETYNPETYEYSEPVVERVLTDSEAAEYDIGLNVNASLKATSSTKLDFTGAVTIGEDTANITGSVYLTDVANFPAVPDEIKSQTEAN